MPRKEAALKLDRSPLVFVLSQVRFPAFLNMEKSVPDIQEALRKLGLPRYSQEDIQQVSFAGPEIKAAEREKRWVFSNRNQDEAVVLTTTFVVYQTTQYDVFETFTDRFSKVLELVAKATETEFAEQIGLRFVDLIRPADEKGASDFLRPHVRGLSQDDLGVSSSRHQFMTQARTELGNLFVRSFENDGPNFLPPDLVSTHMAFKISPEDLKDEPYRVLDIDHIAKGVFDFTSEELIERLWDLHEYSSRAFRAAVTEDAIEFWKKKA